MPLFLKGKKEEYDEKLTILIFCFFLCFDNEGTLQLKMMREKVFVN